VMYGVRASPYGYPNFTPFPLIYFNTK
jgi:hypothetical protein